MITWIASYPKSGNTWVRALLSAYLHSEDGIFDFKLLKKIDQFPSSKFLDFFDPNLKDIKESSAYWVAAQDRINLEESLDEKSIRLLKTHSALCKVNNNPFTNKQNTKAIIHVVRDPRNVVTSLANHFSKSLDETYNFMITSELMLTLGEWGVDGKNAVLLGSWIEHYNSWKNSKIAPRLVVRYEDLVSDTKNTFINILNFLKKFNNIIINEEKINKVIRNCDFNILQEKEKKEGFSEAVESKIDNNKKVNFFYLGKKNNWSDLLNPELEKKITKSFESEMKELSYI